MEIEEIKFGCLKPSDMISIHTDNSVYEFSVINPSSQTGILRGGSLGEFATTTGAVAVSSTARNIGDCGVSIEYPARLTGASWDDRFRVAIASAIGAIDS